MIHYAILLKIINKNVKFKLLKNKRNEIAAAYHQKQDYHKIKGYS